MSFTYFPSSDLSSASDVSSLFCKASTDPTSHPLRLLPSLTAGLLGARVICLGSSRTLCTTSLFVFTLNSHLLSQPLTEPRSSSSRPSSVLKADQKHTVRPSGTSGVEPQKDLYSFFWMCNRKVGAASGGDGNVGGGCGFFRVLDMARERRGGGEEA